jgi:hypothetical protein
VTGNVNIESARRRGKYDEIIEMIEGLRANNQEEAITFIQKYLLAIHRGENVQEFSF